ncbi:hypothetical protein GQ44DRAFT_621643 [Phaeosphaeriaceae sp. PMI808]|nr:hypothetical protein GQ44DRAFT_621643 [Phaeosphaeriaceae sp. PMI808]
MHLPTSPLAQPVTAEDEDRSEAIKLATWVLLGVTVAVFISRQIMKAIVFRKVALDDFFILAATVFAIGLFVTYTILASEGLGVQGILTVERANSLMKGYYASEFLYILSICFSKLSLLVLFYTIVAVQRVHRRLVVGFGGFVLVWSIASLIVVAFQCELPRPWEIMTLRCFNTRAFWIVYCITDLSTEISIIMLSVNLVAYLQVRLSRKFAVVACFAPRALVASASIIRLVWLYPITPYSNPEYQLWLSAILSQMHVCLSICTACIPYMVPFFKSLEGSLRRTNSSKGPEFRMDERSRHTPSSLWFRRQKKSQTFNSWESTAVPSLQYERVPQASPYIPTPRAMSPLTPPHFNSRPGSTRSAASSRRGLSINIPDRHSPLPQSTDIVSPQTASSFALSPSCASPVPLLNMQSFIPSRKAPTPPAKAHSPYPPTSSSHYSSRSNSPASPPRPQRFSLFPQQSPPTLRYSPEMQQSGFTPVHVPPSALYAPK